jgi:hypothetical protein
MIPIKKNLILTILVGTLILLIIPTGVFSRIIANIGSQAYEEGDGQSSISEIPNVSSSIEAYVIEGAGYYLTAYSDLLALLTLVENSDLRGMDYSRAQQLLNRALDNMNHAVKTPGHNSF